MASSRNDDRWSRIEITDAPNGKTKFGFRNQFRYAAKHDLNPDSSRPLLLSLSSLGSGRCALL